MMKIRIYDPGEEKEKVITIPTGFLFSRLGMYFCAKLAASASRKEYDKKVAEMWKTGDFDSMISIDDVQHAEKLPPPLTEEQARELFTALRDSRYLMGGLPLASIDAADGTRVRVDL